jgi:nitroreductase
MGINMPVSPKRAAKTAMLQARSVSRLTAAYLYDARRFVRYSSTRTPFRSRSNLAAKLTERYHGIEKGLSLPEPRPVFGTDLVASVISLTKRYLDAYGEDDVTRAAIGALGAYRAFNAGVGAQTPADEQIDELLLTRQHHPIGQSGVEEVLAADVAAAVAGVSIDFFTSRHSTRVYSEVPVADADVEFAIAAAKSAPAVCNRQFAQIRWWRERSTIDQLLEIQGGARGFGQNLTGLALVSVSVESYWSPAERNQCWIDGGLFAMNFMLGLHARALGAVPLNWSKEPHRDRQLRRALPEIHPSESVIMFVGFGNLADKYLVAASPRLTGSIRDK